MRVLAISEHYLPIIGGSTTYVFNLCRSLSEIGCEVFLVTIPDDENPASKWSINENFHIYRLNIPHMLRKERYFPFFIASKIDKIIEEIRPDIIHFVHGFFAPLVTCLNRKIRSKPIVWTIQNVPSYEDKLDYFRRIKPLHSFLEPIYLNVADIYGHLALRMSKYDVLICVSRSTADAVHARNVPRNKIKIIPNGVDIELFTPKSKSNTEEPGVAEYGPLILTVAGITPTKGLHCLLESAIKVVEEYPSTLFLIIGPVRSEDYYLSLKRMIKKNNLKENVKIILGVDQCKMNMYYSLCDVYAQPSTQEGFCMTVLEAMASGKAVVGTKTGAIPELIRESRGGLLVDPGSPNQLSEALLELLKDDERRKKMGRRGHKYVAENYSWKKIAEETLALYHQIIPG
jgi:glycosyltransferase involved in cell wall biosynthesis